MLPNLNLDDRMYAQIMERARQAIHRYSPEWTDENTHDPGITLLETFAWITEAQQYYINRVTARSEWKFLKLLGIVPQPLQRAVTDVQWRGVSREEWLPAGTRLQAGNTTFETVQPLWLLPHQLERVIVQQGDTTVMHAWQGLRSPEFPLFGMEPEQGQDACFYIGLDRPLPIRRPIHLTFDLAEDEHRHRNPYVVGSSSATGLAVLEWSYYSDHGWQPLHIIRDTTRQLTFDGDVHFELFGLMKGYVLYPASDRQRYWLRCRLVTSGYEQMPVLRHLLLNTVQAVEGHSLIVCDPLQLKSDELPLIIWSHRLAKRGQMEVRVREKEGWIVWQQVDDIGQATSDQACYVLTEDEDHAQWYLYFGNGTHGRVPPSGAGDIMLVAWEQEASQHRYAGASTGMPNQHLRIANPGEQLCELRIQIAEPSGKDQPEYWHEWIRVDHLDSSTSQDKHFVYDTETGELIFGDNRQGRVPPRSYYPNIVLISCVRGGGEQGNIRIGALHAAPDEPLLQPLTAINYTHGHGGRRAETLEHARKRLSSSLQEVDRAVTAADYEEIAMRTPGLRIGRVKALPLYVSGLADYPQRKAPGHMTLVVVPYAHQRKPVPSVLFLEAVRQYVDRYRMLGTELQVIAPQYIEVHVQARIVVEPHLRERKALFTSAIDRYFDPLGQEREFGKTIRSGNLHNWLARIPGVLYVPELWISADGSGAQRDESGNIHIPPHGLTYAGEHEIQLVTAAEVR